jgi:hypothetical protein
MGFLGNSTSNLVVQELRFAFFADQRLYDIVVSRIPYLYGVSCDIFIWRAFETMKKSLLRALDKNCPLQKI